MSVCRATFAREGRERKTESGTGGVREKKGRQREAQREMETDRHRVCMREREREGWGEREKGETKRGE